MISEAAHCADMDCHISSAAHNAAITGPKRRVRARARAAFTIEMRQSAGVGILIISFPRGLRAALQPSRRETSVSSPFLTKTRDE